MGKIFPSIKQIHYFITTAKLLHFGKAAEEMQIQEPMLSREIKKIEEIVGCTLIDRTNRRSIKLTPAGEAYLEQVKEIPALMLDGQEAAHIIAKKKAETLRFSVSVTSYLVLSTGTLLNRFIGRNPQTSIAYNQSSTGPKIIQGLRDNKIDIGFFAADENLSGLSGIETIRITQFSPVVVLHRNSPLATKKIISLADIGGESLILPPREERRWLYPQLIHQYFALFPHAHPSISESTGTILPMLFVANKVGICLSFPIDQEMIPPDISKRITFRPLLEARPLPFLAAYRADNPSRALANFLPVLHKNLPMMAKTTRWEDFCI